MKNNLFLCSKGSRSLMLLVPIFIILSLTFISAAPPVLSTVQAGSLEIVAPTYEFVQAGLDQDIYWHVFNTSNLLTNRTTTCYYHLYEQNLKGEHIVTVSPVKMYSNLRDFEVEVDGANFTVGRYCHIIECNTTSQTGAIERCFEVTRNGFDTNPNFIWYVLALCVLTIATGFLIKNGWIAILGSFGLSFIGLNIIINGINGVKDNVYTWAWGLIVLMVAIYIMVKSSHEMIEDIELG